MTDVAVIWDGDAYEGDVRLDGADLEREDGLRTAVILSLFSDARALSGDIPEDEDPRGVWTDALGTDGDRYGSRLWLLQRSKQTSDVPVLAVEYAREALEWMVEDGVADRVEVSAEWARRGWLRIAPAISRGGITRFREAFTVSIQGL